MRLARFAIATMSIMSSSTIAIAACTLFTDLDNLSTPGSTTSSSSSTSSGSTDGSATQDSPNGNTDGASSGDGSTVTSSAYVNAVLADEPLAYQRFEETSGTFAVDSTSHHNDATIAGSFKLAVQGIAGNGVELKGAVIEYGQRFDFTGIQPYTLEAWVYVSTIDDEYRHLFTKNYEPTQSKREAYGVFVHKNDITFERYVSGNGRFVGRGFASRVNHWAHVVCVYDGAFLIMYVDGEQSNKVSDGALAGAKPTGFHVGARASNDGFFQGLMDEVAIYDRALSADRIKAHFDAIGPH